MSLLVGSNGVYSGACLAMFECAMTPGFQPRRTMQFVSAAEGHEEMRTYIRTLKGQH